MNLDVVPLKRLAAPQGFEPRYADPESAVLPLNEGAVNEAGREAAHNIDSMMSDSQGQMDDEPIVAIACEFPVRFDAASDQTALRFQHTKQGPPVSLAMRFIGWRAAFVDLVALRRQKERERQAENGVVSSGDTGSRTLLQVR